MFRTKIIAPTNKKPKEKLETVPTDKEIELEDKIIEHHGALIKNATTPITFFDMEDAHQAYQISTIMSLPLELQGNDNFDNYRNIEIYNMLTFSELTKLNADNIDIQAENIYGVMLESLLANFQIFAYNAPSIAIMNLNEQDTSDDVYKEFGYCVYNNIHNCMDHLKNHLTNTFSSNIYSIAAVDPDSYEVDDNKINMSVAIMNGCSKQTNEIIAYLICRYMSYYLHKFIIGISDEDFNKIITKIKNTWTINEKLNLNDRVALRSFLSEKIREDIKIILTNNIIPAINHISDNSFITSYFIYRDIRDKN